MSSPCPGAIPLASAILQDNRGQVLH